MRARWEKAAPSVVWRQKVPSCPSDSMGKSHARVWLRLENNLPIQGPIPGAPPFRGECPHSTGIPGAWGSKGSGADLRTKCGLKEQGEHGFKKWAVCSWCSQTYQSLLWWREKDPATEFIYSQGPRTIHRSTHTPGHAGTLEGYQGWRQPQATSSASEALL